MRWLNFILIQILLVIIVCGVIYTHKDNVSLFKTPPSSIAQWYKPENKRQVWLHNMFKLRRELQAVQFYSEEQKPEQLKKWLDRFSEHYLKIGEMVPEWQKKLDVGALKSLQKGIDTRHSETTTQAIDGLNNSCESCHDDYRVVTASMYRAPDFSTIEFGTTESYDAHMAQLIKQVNQIKIASEDGMKALALSSLSELKNGMQVLGESCSSCHIHDTKQYPTDEINQTVMRLEERLASGTPKEQGQEIGALAVQACARCHGTHRLSFDAKVLFAAERDWQELIKH